jgi:hypothetical protein
VSRLLSHAARAFAPVPLVLVACTTAGLALALNAGLLGIPLLAILVSWFAKYAFVLLESTADGRPAPVLSVEMVNPWDERRPVVALLVVAAVIGLLGAVRSALGEAPAAVLAAVALALAPASLVVLAFGGTALRAVDPRACLAVVRGLGVLYPVLVVLGWLCALALATLEQHGARLATIAGAQGLVLAYAALLGGAVHERRLELDYEPLESPERQVERAARDHDRRVDELAERLYGLVRARRPEVAWNEAERWLASGGRRPEDHAALLAHADHWEDRRIAERLDRDLVTRLLALGRSGDALLAIESAWRRGRRYLPRDGRELVRLVQLAADLGHGATADRLLQDGGEAFGAHGEVRALLDRRRR